MAKNFKRIRIPPELEAKLLVESRNTCNLCWKSREVQIHHIDPVEEGGDNSEENLIVVCLNCHSEAHTAKHMARNLKSQTLRLYKETWLDLLRRYPFGPPSSEADENDIKTIRQILQQGYRRALYFPFEHEMAPSMFHSLNEFQVFLQSVGFKLITNDQAREHARLLYKDLVEISFFEPMGPRDYYCIHELGRDRLALLDLRRKTACFHLNELAKLAGVKEEMFAEDEFRRMGFDLPRGRIGAKQCFGHFDGSSENCSSCDFKQECIEASL